MAKALVLLSGGLDSRLACKILQEQMQVIALHIKTPFSKDNKKEIQDFCDKEKIKLHILDTTKGKLFQEYIVMLRHPKHSRGVALNPCIDCHIFMLKKAKEFADKKGIEVIATGEVLGERPLSQKKKALILIQEEAGYDILRPLSAKLLPLTEAERKGLVTRNQLLDIQGRQRKRQIELAKDYRIDYPNAGGGCLLCEKEYCKKLKPLLAGKISYNDIKLLNIGRHFLGSQIILGRNQEENLILEQESGILVVPEQPGATALIKNKKLIDKAKELIQEYSRHKIKKFGIKIK